MRKAFVCGLGWSVLAGGLFRHLVARRSATSSVALARASTSQIRAIERLVRAGGRKSEAEADHLLEGIAVVVYDPDGATIHPEIPKAGTGLRWEEFVNAMVVSYRARFED
jgi:hypothetical protein